MRWGQRRKTEAHEKSMGSYEMHAWRDACAIAYQAVETFGAEVVRKTYLEIEKEPLQEFEDSNTDLIADFIKRSESQRASVVKKLPDDRTRIGFLVLAVLGCLRGREILDLRDQYRYAFAPGSGNRITLAQIYAFSQAVKKLYDYAWPAEVFRAIGESGEDDDGPDDEEEDFDDDAADVAPDPQERAAPAPAPAPRKENQIAVFIGDSPSYMVLEDGRIAPKREGARGTPLWRMVAINIQTNGMSVLLGPQPTDAHLILQLASLIKRESTSGAQAVLIFTKPEAALAERLDRHIGDPVPVTAIANAGLARRSFARCFEAVLEALRLELDLIGEPMPTLKELAVTDGGANSPAWPMLTGWSAADPSERRDQPHLRIEMEVTVKRLCLLRGRWKGPLDTIYPGMNGLTRERLPENYLAKEIKKLDRYEDNGQLTALGHLILGTARLLRKWHEHESHDDAAEVEASLGELIMTAEGSRDQRAGAAGVSFRLRDVCPYGSIDSDFIERSVLRSLASSVSDKVFFAHGSGRRVQAYWANAEVGAVARGGVAGDVSGSLLGLPQYKRIAKLIVPIFAKRGIELKLCFGLQREDWFADRGYIFNWASRYGRWDTAASRLIDEVRNERDFPKKNWVQPQLAAGGARFMLIATASSDAILKGVPAAWSEAAPVLNEGISVALKEAQINIAFAASKELEDYVAPYAKGSHRLSLMLGHSWNMTESHENYPVTKQ